MERRDGPVPEFRDAKLIHDSLRERRSRAEKRPFLQLRSQMLACTAFPSRTVCTAFPSRTGAEQWAVGWLCHLLGKSWCLWEPQDLHL